MTDTAPNSGDRHDVQARVDELPSQMTPDEKAGQLTQHFCVRLPTGAEVDPTLPNGCRGATPSGGAGLAARPGSLLFVTDPTEINRLQRLAVSTSRCYSDST